MFKTIDTLLTGVASGPMETVANLVVALDGAQLKLTSITGKVRIVVESLRAAIRIVRTEQQTLLKLDQALSASGITAPVYVAGTRIALLGAHAEPGWLSRRIADGRTEVDGWGVVKTALRGLRRRATRLRPLRCKRRIQARWSESGLESRLRR
ncbi:hypothetical protein ACFR9U_08235 [Halorientalis brevis]|uniref:Uncharacterized protein n=1 Tax=Halorientalis brevis TaxID=1126241 RepID=A0ABD6CC66_9EURY|nr:hypothetical protein [Halorientalis brevis]